MPRLSLLTALVTLTLQGCSTLQYSKPDNLMFHDQKIKNGIQVTVQRDDKLCASDTIDKQNCPISFYIDNFKAGDFYINNRVNYYLKSDKYNLKVKNCTNNSCKSCDVDIKATNQNLNNFTLSVDEKDFPLILENGKQLNCIKPQLTSEQLIKNKEAIKKDLSADTLFKSNGITLSHPASKGHDEILNLALRVSTGYVTVSTIKLVGHTDRL